MSRYLSTLTEFFIGLAVLTLFSLASVLAFPQYPVLLFMLYIVLLVVYVTNFLASLEPP